MCGIASTAVAAWFAAFAMDGTGKALKKAGVAALSAPAE